MVDRDNPIPVISPPKSIVVFFFSLEELDLPRNMCKMLAHVVMMIEQTMGSVRESHYYLADLREITYKNYFEGFQGKIP